PAAHAQCEQKAARLVSLQGQLDVQEDRPENWAAVTPERDFCPGDRIRTRARSRATLELSNKTYISLNQQTTIVFAGPQPKGPSWLDLLKGIIYVRSRTPSSLDVRTRYINAAIRGTEFLVSADDNAAEVSVLEGTVESSNAQGSLTLTDGQAATAQAGQPPTRKLLIAPRDAVQWALHYPPVVDLASLAQSANPAVKAAASRYQDGDSAGALAALDGAEPPEPLLQAALLISLGRTQEALPLLDGVAETAPRFGEALALRSIVVLAQNDKAQALALARQAVAKQASSAVAWTALSYARQAEFDLHGALDAADTAVQHAPENALARARQAELLAALGRRGEAQDAAEKAAALNPRLSRAQTVQGYAQLNLMDYDAAQQSFQRAISLDNADPLPRFGLGLAKIRGGDLEGGTADLELAANLDPDDALQRSYLGKAYYEQKNSKVAEREFATAKQLDPKDPTPWFYEAIKKQTENRQVEAIHDMRQAIELNGNRAVYRSKLMLDDDLAARGSALGRIYNQAGFQRLGQLEAFDSLEANPANYTAHRLLADTYLNVQRHEMARVSALLQAQLLQPANLTPLQPQQAENNLLTASGLGPADPSMNEFNPLFARNQVSLLPSAMAGSFNTYGNETVLSGIYRQFSGSLGQSHYATSGFRDNNDIDENLYTAFVQGQLAPTINVQAEYRHRDVENGFLGLRFAPTAAELAQQNKQRHTESSDVYRLGAHWSPTQSSDLLASFAYQDGTESYKQQPFPGLELRNDQHRQMYSGEAQYLFRHDWFDAVLGGVYVDQNAPYTTAIRRAGVPIPPTGRQALDGQHGTGYAYFHARYPANVKWLAGLSGDSLNYSGLNIDTARINPKAGLTWEVLPGTALRLAYFRNLRRQMVREQTLEPVQVAGFNQFFDDLVGTVATRYGVALDHHVNAQLALGAELSQRDLNVPSAFLDGGETAHAAFWRERLYRGYLYWTPPGERVSISLEYSYEDFDNQDFLPDRGNPPSTRTHLLPVTISYFHPVGWFASVKTSYVNQQVDADGTGYQEDEFALVDLGLGYRLPKRLGIVQVDVRNLLDQSFRYQSYGLRTQAVEQAPFFPERAVYGRVTLSF
ncbi:MAG: FecR domain-containing protein, partial [Candidatus Methylumidiphilus sp.]